MATWTAVRAGIAARLRTISGLRVYATIPESINPPAAMISGPELIEYDLTYGGEDARWVVPVRVLVGRVSDRAAQSSLDEYLAATGTRSIKAALEGGTPEASLDDAADSVRVLNARNYGDYEFAGVMYLGAEWQVEVID